MPDTYEAPDQGGAQGANEAREGRSQEAEAVPDLSLDLTQLGEAGLDPSKTTVAVAAVLSGLAQTIQGASALLLAAAGSGSGRLRFRRSTANRKLIEDDLLPFFLRGSFYRGMKTDGPCSCIFIVMGGSAS